PEAPAPADAKPEAPAREATPPETPTSVEGLLDAAKQALEYGGTARAISLLQQALRIDPTNSEALVNLGYAYLDAGRRADARQQFERANQVSGGHPDALLGIGDILLDQGSLDAALDAYRRALGRARTPYQRRIAERKVRDLEERLGAERGPAPAPAPIEAGPPESQPVGPP
ncbi:MAG: tetratricopeptide repeat protein, partial [Myxococcota bacterium]|nr:tetratricopeptide repeat protein [Myxococcota bacterium]